MVHSLFFLFFFFCAWEVIQNAIHEFSMEEWMKFYWWNFMNKFSCMKSWTFMEQKNMKFLQVLYIQNQSDMGWFLQFGNSHGFELIWSLDWTDRISIFFCVEFHAIPTSEKWCFVINCMSFKNFKKILTCFRKNKFGKK